MSDKENRYSSRDYGQFLVNQQLEEDNLKHRINAEAEMEELTDILARDAQRQYANRQRIKAEASQSSAKGVQVDHPLETEICNECGRSVKRGSDLFADRIEDTTDFDTRIELDKPYPTGEYICRECYNQLCEEIAAQENDRPRDAGEFLEKNNQTTDVKGYMEASPSPNATRNVPSAAPQKAADAPTEYPDISKRVSELGVKFYDFSTIDRDTQVEKLKRWKLSVKTCR